MKTTYMKNLLFTLLLISFTASSQEFNFEIHKTSLQDYLELEENMGGKRIENSSHHVSFNGGAQPIKFQREQEVIPDLITSFHFQKEDSTMTRILYEWDVYNFEKNSNNQKSKEFQSALIEKYKSMKKIISDNYGQPEVKRNYSNISLKDSINTFIESSTWQPNDSTEIELHATVSNYYEKREYSTINPVHRIRLYVKNSAKPKKKNALSLTNETINELKGITQNFLLALKIDDIRKSKEFLSELIVDKVTEEQLNALKEGIDLNRDLELIYSGLQMGLNGMNFTLLQYKYADENSSVPTEMIKVIFDNKNQIVGIQPMQRQTIEAN